MNKTNNISERKDNDSTRKSHREWQARREKIIRQIEAKRYAREWEY